MRLLDTDVCVEILRGNQSVIDRRAAIRDQVATTRITAAELFYGAAKSAAPSPNEDRVASFLGTLRLIELGDGATRRFGRIKAYLENQGRRLADADLLIAATALARGAILVTGNTRHYGRVPDLVIDDWIRG